MWLYVQTCDQKLVHKFRCSQAIRKIVVHCSTSWEQQEDLQYNHAYEAADFGKWYVLLLSFYSFLAMNLTFCRYGSTLLYFTSFLVHSLHSFCVNRGERSEITKNGVIACRPGMTEWPQRIKKARTNESIRILRRQKSPHYLDLFSISYQTHSNPGVLYGRLDVVDDVECVRVACCMLVPACASGQPVRSWLANVKLQSKPRRPWTLGSLGHLKQDT